jgi:hypothetical protein
VNQTQLQSSRRLPIQVNNAYVFGGVADNWVDAAAVGSVHNPGWGSVDFRAQYIRPVGRLTTEFFMDIFDLFNDQAVVRTEDLVAGTGSTHFGDDITWVQPLRAFFGARVRFSSRFVSRRRTQRGNSLRPSFFLLDSRLLRSRPARCHDPGTVLMAARVAHPSSSRPEYSCIRGITLVYVHRLDGSQLFHLQQGDPRHEANGCADRVAARQPRWRHG